MGDERVALHHPFWSIELPRAWIDRVPLLWDVLRRNEPAHVLDLGVHGVAGLVTLLELQGCLSYPDDCDEYTLRDVRELFRPIASRWYGIYYRHPLWTRLRDGTLSRRGLVAWLIHNYHVSRSAGMSDARCAVRLPRVDLRAAFARNALDEYSHCEDFFFVRHPRLAIADEDVKQYVHLAPSLAFDQLMMRMAEDDWLGHLLVSFFQESTARFSEQTRAFYRQVEARYGLDGLFNAWEKHLDLDLACRHAGRLDDLFSGAETYVLGALQRSLRNAWFTVQHLLASLDAIVAIAESGAEPSLRLPIHDGVLDPRNAFVAHAAPALRVATTLDATSGLALHEMLVAAGAGISEDAAPAPAEDVCFLEGELGRAIFLGMSHSSRHDDVILFGRLAEHVSPSLDGGATPASAEATGVACFFREAAIAPADLAFLLHRGVTSSPDASWVPVDERGAALLLRYLGAANISGETRDRWATLALQLDESLARWRRHRGAVEPVDFFRD